MTIQRVPVVLVAFNRPETTRRVAEAIAASNPPKVYLVLDGPRAGNLADVARCDEVAAVLASIPWPCPVEWNQSRTNLGLRGRTPTGLDWVFEQTDRAIILEDDCLPIPSFFRFCEELLDRYSDDATVTSIAGTNVLHGKEVTGDSYYASRYGTIWGWATWKRVWDAYDVDLVDWPERRSSGWLDTVLDDRATVRTYTRVFDRIHFDNHPTWDGQTLYANWKQGGLALIPSRNLVSNIGDEGDGMHMRRRSVLSRLPTHEMEFPLRHPEVLERNQIADRFLERLVARSRAGRIVNQLRALPRIVVHRLAHNDTTPG